MEFSAGAAIGAGLVATGVMTAMLYMGIALMPQRMTMNLLYMLGTMMTRGTTAAYLVGAMMHGSMGVVFALSHVGAYQVFGLQSDLLGWGVFFGFLHWIAFGVGLGMVGTVHPLMRTGQMAAPGAFALNYPAATVAGALMVHLVYGALVGVLYEAWV